ncbi:polysaccharide chain length determinant protein (PEP-CTERM system associated) [Mycoplana sp. BE70]|uniref:GumC family protein n=1 Tax=Mycoplana sp. BE70 TaxID=2817775 RepID=UPI0028675F1E|nr:lipopolysaccharide biosynthesis protein [Mycoplana sp. BE70]MDR6759613.1 polysaccharide chain length determinant protein (PEP-CTERM system associated) [Mycoplana sp. BE70]
MNSMDLRFYISLVLRRLPLVLAVAVTAFLAAVVVGSMMPKLYRASAKVLVEAPQIPSELARSSVAIGAIEQLQVLQQQIITRKNLIELADRLGIYADTEERPADDDIVADLRSRISFEQLALATSSRDQDTTIFEISFTGRDPVLAAMIANEITSMLVDRNQQQRTARAGNTLQFFNQEVARLGTELNKLEADILKFKTENKDTLPDSVEFRRSQQNSLQERVSSLEREESELRSRRSALIATYTNTGRLSDAIPLTPEQQMLADLNRALAEQLALFSETSPNVAALRKRIATLQSRLPAVPVRDAAREDKKQSDAETASFGLDLQLSDIDERLQAIGRERAEASRRIEDLSRSITATPASETVLNALERNRENIQTQYNAAIARRAEASTGKQIEMRSDGGRLTLIEAATPPLDPTNPRRGRIILLGAPLGIALGIGLVLLLELMNRTVRRPADIAKLLQTQPLATIPDIRSVGEIRSVGRKHRIAALLSAGAVPAALLLIHHFVMPLHLVVQKIISGQSGSI